MAVVYRYDFHDRAVMHDRRSAESRPEPAPPRMLRDPAQPGKGN